MDFLFKLYGITSGSDSGCPFRKLAEAGTQVRQSRADQPKTNPGSPTYPLTCLHVDCGFEQGFLTIAVVERYGSEQKFI